MRMAAATATATGTKIENNRNLRISLEFGGGTVEGVLIFYL